MINEYWLPQALIIGVDYNLFWKMNPNKLKPFIEAYKQKEKAKFDTINYQCWLTGFYNAHAINATIKDAEYFKKPIDFSEKSASETEIAVAKFEAYAMQLNKKLNKVASIDGSRPTGNTDKESSDSSNS